MEPQPREIQEYQTSEGTIPFTEWLESLRDLKARVKIGNLGDYRSVGEGVCELEILLLLKGKIYLRNYI